MGTELVSIRLAAGWVADLGQRLATVRARRRDEFDRIADRFNVDPSVLASRYIEPEMQFINPVALTLEDPVAAARTLTSRYLSGFLGKAFTEAGGRNVLFVLADAGMGKTSLLVMLKLSHMTKFWPEDVRFELMKLGPGVVPAIRALQRKRHTVLLLDSLDEDPDATGRIRERLSELLEATSSFRQVIITCRSQYLPRGGHLSVERADRVELEGFECNRIYLAPFSDEQVLNYLRRRFPNRGFAKVRRWITGRDNPKLVNAERLVEPMTSLRMRPMLLERVDDLMEAGVSDWRQYNVYKALVNHWLLREEQKNRRLKREALWSACEALAFVLHKEGVEVISADRLKHLTRVVPELAKLSLVDVGGRSLLNATSEGEFRFAHRTIQEFLVVHALASGSRRLKGRVPATSEMVEFLGSWAEAATEEERGRLALGRFDLSGVDFTRKRLRDLDFSGMDLSSTSFVASTLERVRLERANLDGADFSEARLDNCYLRGASLRRANLSEADLVNVDLSGAILKFADLSRAGMRDARLQGCRAYGASFRGADLRGANMSKADFVGVDFKEALLEGSKGGGPLLDMFRERTRRSGQAGIDFSTEPSELICQLSNVVVIPAADRYLVCHNPVGQRRQSPPCHAVYLLRYISMLGGTCARCEKPLLVEDLHGRGAEIARDSQPITKQLDTSLDVSIDWKSRPEELVCLLTNQVVRPTRDKFLVCHQVFPTGELCHAVYLLEYIHLLDSRCRRCHKFFHEYDLLGFGV